MLNQVQVAGSNLVYVYVVLAISLVALAIAWGLRSQVLAAADGISVLGQTYPRDAWTNITPAITSKLGRGLLHQHNHPLAIIKVRNLNEIFYYFNKNVNN